MDIPETIEVPEWYKSGSMMRRRDALPPEHPESTYNYIKRTYGVDPELYGVTGRAVPETCPHCKKPLNGHEADDTFGDEEW